MSTPEIQLGTTGESSVSDLEVASFEAALDLATRDAATSNFLRLYYAERIAELRSNGAGLSARVYGPDALSEAKAIFSVHDTVDYPDFYHDLHSRMLEEMRAEQNGAERPASDLYFDQILPQSKSL